jgi:putative acyl-CoA dehydrogenase
MDTLDRPAAPLARTHEVFNQTPPLVEYDSFATDTIAREAVRRADAGWAESSLHEIGRRAGSAQAIAWGFEANAHEPELTTHDRYGHRIDEVAFHPSYHHLMKNAVRFGLHAAPWREPGPGAHVARAAGFYLWSQTEGGHGCPISMTYAVVPALRTQNDLALQWERLIFASTYEPVLMPANQKGSAIFGMAMTEKQGGSDVRANTTRASAVGAGGPGAEYSLVGHKWFCSAPMSDAFLVLAKTDEGVSCFLVPRFRPDGTRNIFNIQRLKNKLGNRSNASSEVEFAGTSGWLVGDEGRGVQTILEMVNMTRLDCIIGSASGMRQALVQAIHHMRHRAAFGRTLIDQPLAQNVLADLAIESVDRALAGDAREAKLKRIGTAIGKYWVCKRNAVHVGEALECLGGNGFVEESIMPRLFRESPLNSIWEGSGNVNALDVLRALGKEAGVLDAYFAEVETARGADARLDRAIDRVRAELADQGEIEFRARRIVELLALVFQAALLVKSGASASADAFCATRLGDEGGRAFGTLPRGTPARAIVDRAFAGV